MRTAFLSLDTKHGIAKWLKVRASATASLEPVFLDGESFLSAALEYERVIFVCRCDDITSLARPDGYSIIDKLPEAAISRLRTGGSSLLLDNSFERLTSIRDIFIQFHKSIEHNRLDPKRIVIASQCWNLGETYRQTLELSHQNSPHFVFLHAFLNSLVNISRKSPLNENGLTKSQEQRLLDLPTHESLKILCLNNIVKPHRLANALNLFARFPAQKLELSFADIKDEDKQADLQKCIDYIRRNLKPFENLLDYLPEFQKNTPFVQDKHVGSVAARQGSVIHVGEELGGNCNLEIVTESEFANYSLMRVSEKAFKPLYRGIPFMILGNPSSHNFLLSLGFASYSPIINHCAYDNTESPSERLGNFFSQLERVNRLIDSHGIQAMQQLSDRIRYNARRANQFLPTLCDQSLTYLIETLVNSADSKKSYALDPVLSLVRPHNKYSYAIPLVVRPKDIHAEPSDRFSMVRILSHLPSSGGSPISRAIAAMPNIVLLSEIHPYASDRLTFSPMRQYLQYYADSEFKDWLSSPAISESLTFRESIRLIASDCERHGKILVIRDWAFLDFIAKSSKPLMYRSITEKELSDTFLLKYCATSRHPADTWLSFLNSGFAPGLSLDDFAAGYLKFANYIYNRDWFKYEDFCIKPDNTLLSICNSLEIEFTPSYKDRMKEVRHITGNSGRRGIAIEQRTKRQPTPLQKNDMIQNEAISAAIRLLDY